MIRAAKKADLAAIEALLENARGFMEKNGNPTQWRNGYPPRELIESDIETGIGYVCEHEGQVHAYFAFILGRDKTYEVIDGAWLNEEPYGTLHRVAASGQVRGMMDEIVRWAWRQCPNLRADTHERNAPMRRALERNGFVPCGTIWVFDGTPRVAYHKCEGGAACG